MGVPIIYLTGGRIQLGTMANTNPQPGDKYQDKNNNNVFVIQKVTNEYVIIQRPNYDVNRQIPHNIFEKGYTKAE